jgi:hypothetical protein
VCGSTIQRFVEALKLVWRNNLAMIARWACRGCSGIVSLELRLDDVTDGTATEVRRRAPRARWAARSTGSVDRSP